MHEFDDVVYVDDWLVNHKFGRFMKRYWLKSLGKSSIFGINNNHKHLSISFSKVGR